MNELDDFFHSVAKAHVTAAAMHYFGMQEKTEKPTKHAWPHLLSMTQSTAPHWQYLSTTIGKFVDEYVMPSFLFDLSSTKKTTRDSDTSSNGIHNYACSFMADLLLVEEFNDAVHEGDGERMLTIWKLLLLNFRATGHTNYAAESVRLIAEASALLTERDAHRLKWCRFINTKGKPGKNISCDLGMEHWNRAFKQHLATAGGNIAFSTIIRTGMALSTLNEAIDRFDEVTNISPQAVHHTTKSSKKDENTMLEALHSKYKVFGAEGSHFNFPSFSRNHLVSIDKKKFEKWIQGHINKLSKIQNKELKLSQHNQHKTVSQLNPDSSMTIIDELAEWD